jgi:hypothetical protein
MIHDKCSRCLKKSVSKKYISTTGPNISVKNNPKLGEDIQTCNLCTSPLTRKKFDNGNSFDRFETHLLNIILLEIQKNKNIKYISANLVNPDTTRYDLHLADTPDKNDATKSLLVEIDEAQHFDLAGKYDGEIREQIFFRKYNGPGVLRIRVAEDGKLDDGSKCTPVLTKSGGYVCISNEKRYRSNIKKITDYIAKFFKTGGLKIAYINIADDIGIRDMTKLELEYREGVQNILKVEKKWNKLIDNKMSVNTGDFARKELNKRIDVDDLMGRMNNLNIGPSKAKPKENNPDKKSMTCLKKSCKNKTKSVTGYCPEHKP